MMILSNAQIVLSNQIITGHLLVEDGLIAAIEPGQSRAGIDCDGDFLIPGIIDLHTDNLERQVLPRSNARWPSRSALLAHDAQCAVAGVTTVFDALCLGDIGFEKERLQTFLNGQTDLAALADTELLKANHFLHLRCELPSPTMLDLLDAAIVDPLVRLISLMDHSPGVGQYADIAKYRQMRAGEGHSDEAITAMIDQLQQSRARWTLPNRAAVLSRARDHGIPVASHDDRTVTEVTDNHRDGIGIAEFPVTHDAAAAARARGIATIGGAPNIVRGGSHSGNVAVLDLVRVGLIDALASDYVPASMIEAAFTCVAKSVLALPAAIALISAGPAAMVGLADRGQIAPGLRADLVQVRLHQDMPVIRAVWRAGTRVA
jgi:alpha-D-ribose 1-methylphosphonate 5-triphosphate diphosphatase